MLLLAEEHSCGNQEAYVEQLRAPLVVANSRYGQKGGDNGVERSSFPTFLKLDYFSLCMTTSRSYNKTWTAITTCETSFSFSLCPIPRITLCCRSLPAQLAMTQDLL